MEKRRVGVFVDADNVLPYWRAIQPLEQRINEYLKVSDFQRLLTEIDDRAAEEGEVLVREAYGKWDNKARIIPASLMHHRFGYTLQHVPPLARRGTDQAHSVSLKNAGDILLASRAILSAATGPEDLDTVIVVAADTDYHPLVAELKRLGKRVICLSFPLHGQQQKLLAAVFDKHVLLRPVSGWTRLKDDQNAPVSADTARAAETARPIEPEPLARSNGMATPRQIAERLWELLAAPGTAWPPLGRALTEAVGIPSVDMSGVLVRLTSLDVASHVDEIWQRTDTLDRETWLNTVAEALARHFVVRAMRLTRLPEQTPGEQIMAMRTRALEFFAAPDAATIELVDLQVARRAVSLSTADHLTG